MITLKEIVNINTNINELKKIGLTFIFDIAKILANDLKVTNKILEDEIENVKTIEDKYLVYDVYGERICNVENIEALNSELDSFYKNKTYDEKAIKLEFIQERDFKAREEYKSMKFDVQTMELLNPIIKFY